LSAEVVLEAKGITKHFGGVVAAEDVDLTLERGKVTVLLGPNGAGKTTVFNLLTGRIQPDRGEITFDGRDISGLSVARRARLGMGRTFQDVRLFADMSVRDNVAVYGQPEATVSLGRTLLAPHRRWIEGARSVERGREALAYIRASNLEKRICRDLSYAEQKLVSIARLLAMESRLMLLDEPASGVDDVGAERLMSLVERLAADGRTICLIEHNLDVVRRLADRVVFLAEGAVVADGEPEKIFNSRELAEIYLGDRRGRG
jgi:ABC-type branched-subunit amino acid transport system ATPase component